MMAQPVPHQATDKKRVKVYELRNNDWFDKGTGFCTATFATDKDGQRDPRVIVESEDVPDRILLETKIQKQDGFQKQQETLIVWQEPQSGVDMALSFQEAEGCSLIWRFVSTVQQSFHNNLEAGEDGLSDDLAVDIPLTVKLPPAELGNLPEIVSIMSVMNSTGSGRDALTKCIMSEDYIVKLVPLVEMAEDLESLSDLHRLCNIMKTIILLNDTSIIEHAVSDECVLGVVGALEYDPDFPQHKASHRQYLGKEGRFKEVVPVEDEQTLRKIHQTYRLQYLKDVVLARILDDPTFSVLNSLIFFNQVEIIQHIQTNNAFLDALFTIFRSPLHDQEKKKEGVMFIQQCCGLAKNIQPQIRQALYQGFMTHGLISVINFGSRSADVGVRVAATDILTSVIDHDPHIIRSMIYQQLHDDQTPLVDTMVELLLKEGDIGIKHQICETIKVLLDQGMAQPGPQDFAKMAQGDMGGRPKAQPQMHPNHELLLSHFYEVTAPRLFKPLTDLEGATYLRFTAQHAETLAYLLDLLVHFVKMHNRFVRFFILNSNMALRVTQLLQCPEKFQRLNAIRFLRCLIGTQEEFYVKHVIEKQVLRDVLKVLAATLPKDTLLSSVGLELFEYIKKENLREVIKYLVENFRETLTELSYMSTFHDILMRYDQSSGFSANMDFIMEPEDEEIGRRQILHSTGMAEHLTVDPAEEEYWNTSDPEDEDETRGRTGEKTPASNGTSTPSKALVEYSSDEEGDENADPAKPTAQEETPHESEQTDAVSQDSESNLAAPPERLSEKRRREEDDEDEMDKLVAIKRRNSTSSNSTTGSKGLVQRRKSFTAGAGNGTPKKIAISLGTALRSGGGGSTSGEDS